ncbi:SNF7 family domain-containing protein, putative [Eimeria maxima]|uniref:SNF7 family domain-containing protein, putative n=1 Tax=Eimeria maxima TaxID=5804 RepID=U6M3J7_EIMMA|nr:SNF7 family domain-containing protein, putative [Eimeria maxima]CDJ56270.1 SNF7 family domain-containing protein, putative [Eimeria maxima]
MELGAVSCLQNISKLQTKQLLLLRRRREAILRCKAQLGTADLQVQQQQATQELHRHFTGCAKLLSLANKAADLQTMQVAVKGFTRESQKLGLLDEMLNEVLEDGTAHFEDEEETEEEIQQELIEYANSEIDRQLPLQETVCKSPIRDVPLLGQVQQQQQQQQRPQRPKLQQQQALRKPKQMLLQQFSTNQRTATRAPWLSKDEATMAEQLEQRLGSLLR